MEFLPTITRPVIAHRGNRAHAPENTLEAFRRALLVKPDALEFDVRLSSDGVAMVIHDETVDRTTNGRGAVASLTCAHLQRLDAGWSYRSPRGAAAFRGQGVTIPTLEEVLAAVGTMPVVIEVKEVGAVAETKRLIRAFDLEGRVLVGSVSRDVMAHFYGGPYATCASLMDAARLLSRAITRRRAPAPPFSVLSITPWYPWYVPVPVPVVTLTRIATGLGIPTHVWTINSARQASTLWRVGVSAIVSDDVAPIIEARDALSG